MTPQKRPLGPTVWLGALGLLGVSILFAPVITGGWCADAPVAGAWVCGSFQRSLIGIDTNVWLWLASVVGVVLVTVVSTRRRRKARPLTLP